MGNMQALPASTAEAAPLRPTAVRWRIVAVLLAYSFLSWFNRVSMPIAYDERIRGETGISEQAIGYVYSALLFAYMLCMTPGGAFVDRRGGWLALTVMGLGSALFVALTGVVGLLAHTAVTVLVALLVVRAAMGVFTAPIYPASGHLLAAWLPARQRAAANGAVMAAALLGIASTYYGFGALLDRFDWPGAFLITGAATAVVGLLWTWYGRNQPAQHPAVNESELEWIRSSEVSFPATDARAGGASEAASAPREEGLASERVSSGIGGRTEITEPGIESFSAPGDLRDSRMSLPTHDLPETNPYLKGDGWALLRNRSLVLLTLSYAAIGYFEYLFYFWMHFYFDEVLNVGKGESRWYSTLVTLAMAAGMLLGGFCADQLTRSYGRRRGRAAVVVSGMLGGAGLLGCGLLASTPEWIVLWLALAAAAVGATEGPFWATAVELGGRRAGAAAGIFNTGGNAGGVLAPVLTPLVSARYGWQWGIGLSGLVCLAGVFLWCWIDPDER